MRLLDFSPLILSICLTGPGYSRRVPGLLRDGPTFQRTGAKAEAIVGKPGGRTGPTWLCHPRAVEGRPSSLSVLRRQPVFLGQILPSLLGGALALIRQLSMLGSQLPKGGSRFNIGDRFSDTRESLRLSAVIGTTVHVNPSAIFHAA
jgi:hypothetical protein